jgi:ElaB/YqjD/DUF883 family membrane-anchored ribosome-binding protein
MTSSAHLQREADAARAGLADTLDELRGNMTKAAITSGAMTLAKEGSATFARAAVHRASANPLAALLIGAGVVMLLTHSGEWTRSNQGGNGSGAGHLPSRAGNALKSAASTVGSAVSGARTAAADATTATRRVAVSAIDQATEGVDKAKDLLAEGQRRAGETLDQVQQRATSTVDRLSNLAHEQPILVAALAVAVGAAVGAAIPLTEAEKRYLSEPGARAARKGRDLAEHVAGAVGAKAGEVADTVVETVTADFVGTRQL